jgi:hypothetical protein
VCSATEADVGLPEWLAADGAEHLIRAGYVLFWAGLRAGVARVARVVRSILSSRTGITIVCCTLATLATCVFLQVRRSREPEPDPGRVPLGRGGGSEYLVWAAEVRVAPDYVSDHVVPLGFLVVAEAFDEGPFGPFLLTVGAEPFVEVGV